MKRLALAAFALPLLVVSTAMFAQSSSTSSSMSSSSSSSLSSWSSSSAVSSGAQSCAPNYIRCMSGYQPVCNAGAWSCQADTGSSSSKSVDKCIAKCADGYEYRTCTEDGHVINYFADPCLTHGGGAKSSVSNNESCGASSILCIQGRMPVCSNGEWICRTAASSKSSKSSRNSCDPAELAALSCMTGATAVCEKGKWQCRDSAQGDITIDSLSPSTASVWSRVTIKGSGFLRRGNIVQFADSIIPRLRSLDGTTLSFRIPARTVRGCFFAPTKKCDVPIVRYGAGEYDVLVRAGSEISNALKMIVR